MLLVEHSFKFIYIAHCSFSYLPPLLYFWCNLWNAERADVWRNVESTVIWNFFFFFCLVAVVVPVYKCVILREVYIMNSNVYTCMYLYICVCVCPFRSIQTFICTVPKKKKRPKQYINPDIMVDIPFWIQNKYFNNICVTIFSIYVLDWPLF